MTEESVQEPLRKKVKVASNTMSRTQDEPNDKSPFQSKKIEPAESKGAKEAGSDTKRQAKAPIAKPPRAVVQHSGPIEELRMDSKMEAYHGSKDIPTDIMRLRDNIKNNHLNEDGTVNRSARKEHQSVFRNNCGRIKSKHPLMEFYMDRRVFGEVTWDILMNAWLPKEDRWTFGDLGELKGQVVGAVTPPDGYDYSKNLLPNVPREGDDEAERSSASFDGEKDAGSGDSSGPKGLDHDSAEKDVGVA